MTAARRWIWVASFSAGLAWGCDDGGDTQTSGTDLAGVDAAGDSGDSGASARDVPDSAMADTGGGDDGRDPSPDVPRSDLGDDLGADADTGGGPAGCDVTVEVLPGITLATTETTPVAAGSSPIICWTVPGDATMPGAGGWVVRVEREDKAGTDEVEWLVDRGVPTASRSLTYGECPAGATCSAPNVLAAGSHFVSMWDADSPQNLGGSTVFTVE